MFGVHIWNNKKCGGAGWEYRRSLAVVAFLMAVVAVPGRAQGEGEHAGHRRTQEIALAAGWNSVFLEVEPADKAPAKVFAGVPVDRVATLFRNPTSRQFVTDPTVDLSRAGSGWGVWYAPKLPEAFLKSLDEIEGNRAYLVHATEAAVWRVSGRVRGARTDWQPDAYHLVGFPVRSPGGPTFEQFFAGSKAHRDQPIYRLVDGRWKRVLEPGAEVMRSGEAFWIYCAGGSEYEGPLGVETLVSEGLLLGRGASDLILRNECGHPLTPTVHHVPGDDGAPVPLSVLVRSYGNPAAPVAPMAVTMPAGAWEQALPPLELGGSMAIPFECRAAELGGARQGSLLKITTDLGTETWVPVVGFRDDLGE